MTTCFHESQQQVFTTEAVIVKIDESKGWYFDRCRTCHAKIYDGMPHWHCQQVGTQVTPNYTYYFKAVLADIIGSVFMTCFSPAADSLLPRVTKVLSYITDPDPYVFTRHNKRTGKYQPYISAPLWNRESKGYPKFILDHASDAPLPTLPAIPRNILEGEPSLVTEPAVQEAMAAQLVQQGKSSSVMEPAI